MSTTARLSHLATSTSQTQCIRELHFFATLGHLPDVELALVQRSGSRARLTELLSFHPREPVMQVSFGSTLCCLSTAEGVPSQAFIIRIVVAPQQDSYRFVTTPQQADAMLHRMHPWEGGLPQEGGDEVTRTARHTEEGADGRGTRVKRALLVEDHRLVRQSLAVVLEEHTDLENTVQAGSLAEARQIWGHLPSEVNLAIVDLDLPDDEGIKLIENLREAAPEIPVLALTDSRDMERRAWAFRAGADEVLSTASSGEEIVGVVQQLVGR